MSASTESNTVHVVAQPVFYDVTLRVLRPDGSHESVYFQSTVVPAEGMRFCLRRRVRARRGPDWPEHTEERYFTYRCSTNPTVWIDEVDGDPSSPVVSIDCEAREEEQLS